MWWCKSRSPCIRLLGTSAKCILWYKGFTPKCTELSSLQHLYWHHEQAKKREYGDRICGVENGSFTPLVFATTGGMGQEATLFYKYLADSLSEKRNITYSKTIAWMRCTLSLSFLQSALMCIRGSRSQSHRVPDTSLKLGAAAAQRVDSLAKHHRYTVNCY